MIKKITGAIFGILAMAIGVYPLLYFLADEAIGIQKSKTDLLLSDVFWNIGFYAHIALGGLALFIGWIQFNKKIRRKRPQFHRRIGMIYVVAVLISATASIYIGFFATGGPIAKIGFITLGVFWFYTTSTAFISIKKGNIAQHQKFMIYSYAACFGAVTLRIWLPILIILHEGRFIPAYRIVAWLAWVPNVIVAYFIIKKNNNKVLS
tara:strand:+ start:825184 stop:825804 length:621 start_codon:yes stop_codon:yes gene_type:complete